MDPGWYIRVLPPTHDPDEDGWCWLVEAEDGVVSWRYSVSPNKARRFFSEVEAAAFLLTEMDREPDGYLLRAEELTDEDVALLRQVRGGL